MEKVFVIGTGLDDIVVAKLIAAMHDREVVVIQNQEDIDRYASDICELDNMCNIPEIPFPIVPELNIVEPEYIDRRNSNDDYNKQQQRLRNKYNQKRR